MIRHNTARRKVRAMRHAPSGAAARVDFVHCATPRTALIPAISLPIIIWGFIVLALMILSPAPAQARKSALLPLLTKACGQIPQGCMERDGWLLATAIIDAPENRDQDPRLTLARAQDKAIAKLRFCATCLKKPGGMCLGQALIKGRVPLDYLTRTTTMPSLVDQRVHPDGRTEVTVGVHLRNLQSNLPGW